MHFRRSMEMNFVRELWYNVLADWIDLERLSHRQEEMIQYY
jgi:hypothetical protein